MTNTEGRIAQLEELPAWEDSELLPKEEPIAELAVYGFDSDKRTLVGLGPVERARRSREAAEIPDSRRLPQSEPPGPFVADDDDLPRSFRGRELRPWAIAVPAALIAIVAAAVVLVHRAASEPPSPSKAAAAPPP